METSATFGHEKVLQFALDHLKTLTYVKQIWLFGSYARKQNRYNSDLDLYVVIDEKYNTPRNKVLMRNNCCSDDYTLPEPDIHFGIKEVEMYKDSADFIDNSESLFIRNIKKEGVKLWQI